MYNKKNSYQWYMEKQDNTPDYKKLQQAYKGLNNVWKTRPIEMGAFLDEHSRP